MQHRELYKSHIRPDQSQLIELMSLDREYVTGKNNWIYDNKGTKYLDFTGSYGANTLGHGNILRSLAANFLRTESLSFLQGHQSIHASKLANTINKYLASETKLNNWTLQFSNSGTEAVEIALKVSKYKFSQNLKKKQIKIQELYNKARRELEEIGKIDEIENLLEIKDHNKKVFSKAHKIICLEKAFHGKTNESLKLTYNNKLKEDIITKNETSVITEINKPLKLVRKIEENKSIIKIPYIENGLLKYKEESFYHVAAIIAEPIQGEGGIIELEKDFLAALREQATRLDALLIFDEIQTGCFRTGKMVCSSELGINADIYTFSKGLSAGFSKSGITAINSKLFPKGFDLIQSSTFAEDSLSCYVANKALKLAKSHYENNQEAIQYLKQSLEFLKDSFPNIVSSVRGKGLMLALEFSKELNFKNYEFKYFFDAEMFGHLISSALLNNENIRIAPTLSNQTTLRVQPSINVTKDEIDFFMKGITRLLNAIKNNDSSYFFSHLFPGIKIGPFNPILESVKKAITKKLDEATFFLNHPIQTTDVKKIVTAFTHVPDEELECLMHATFKLQKFTPYYATEVIGDNGVKTTIVMLSIPVTSKVLYEKFRSKELGDVVKKAQDAINFAKSCHGTTVGLGQFTSIVTKNGMFLDNQGLNLTTGNSYTAKLAYDAGKTKNFNKKPIIGFVGYGGNIITTMVSLAVKDAKKIVLFHRGKEVLNNKVLGCLHELIHHIESQSDKDTEQMRRALKMPYETMEQLLFNIKDYIVITNKLDSLNLCDVIYTGTNSTNGLFNIDQVKNKAHIVDLAVPGDFYGPTKSGTREVTHTKGGIASFPRKNGNKIQIEIPSFPLGENQSFACMAETFSYGLSETKDNIQIGPISINDIQKISLIAQKAGFSISGDKNLNSM